MRTGLFILVFILTFSCFYGQERILKFSFEIGGFAFYEKVIITQDSTFIFELDTNVTLKRRFSTSTQTWDKLNNSIKNYSLKDLENLPSPTNFRMFDGAKQSHIIISTDKKDYNCGDFDSYNPNDKLKDLLTIILENL